MPVPPVIQVPAANRKRVMELGEEHEVWSSATAMRTYFWCNVCGVIAGGRAGDGTSFAPNFCRGPPEPRQAGARVRPDDRIGQLRRLRNGTHKHQGTKEVIPIQKTRPCAQPGPSSRTGGAEGGSDR